MLMTFGFSIDKLELDNAPLTSTTYQFVGVTDPSIEEQQKEIAAIEFGQRACPGEGALSCIQQVYDTMGDAVGLEGGNYDFSYTNILINNNAVDPTEFNCPFSRCGTFNSLDYSHGDGTFHIDTADVWFIPIGSIVHLVVDIWGGNTWWSGGIPRPR
jgi:hypothetical protein